MIKTHIPARPRNKKIVPTGGASISPSITSAVGSSHTHNNKSILDLINQGNIDVLSKLFIDAEGNLYTTENFYSQQGVSAYGPGVEGGGGVDISKLLSWAGYTSEMADYYAPASLLVPFYNDATSRLTSLEGGSASTVTTSGTGNGVADVTKSGTVITVTKGNFAELDGSGKVLSSQLPSYVDDVMEFASFSALPSTGESGKIYITTDTNRQYRWTGSTYAEISSSLALGETSSTAYRGDRGKIAYDHSQSEHQAIINGTGFVKASGKTLSYDNNSYSLSTHNHSGVYEPANVNIQSHISSTSNPHSVTKAQVGLGNVDNTSDADKPVSTATQTALNAKADDADLMAHTSSMSNPHGVTASQVGLGNVLNVASYSKTESDAKYPTLTNYNAHVADAVKHITAAERTAWNGAVTDQHTHANKTQIDGITALHLQILSKLNVDASGNLYATENFYSVGGVSAYGPGIGDDSGIQSAYDVWLSAGNTGTKDDFFAAIVAPAITAVQSYTEAEKLIARTNIGALSASAVNDVTNYNEINI